MARPRPQAHPVQPPLLPGRRHARRVHRAAPRLRPLLRTMLPRRARPPLPVQVPRAGARLPFGCRHAAGLLQGEAQWWRGHLTRPAARRLPRPQPEPAQPALPQVRGHLQPQVKPGRTRGTASVCSSVCATTCGVHSGRAAACSLWLLLLFKGGDVVVVVVVLSSFPVRRNESAKRLPKLEAVLWVARSHGRRSAGGRPRTVAI